MKVQSSYFDWSVIFDPKEYQKSWLKKIPKKNQDYVYSELEKLWRYVENNAEKLNYSDEKLEDYQQEELSELRLVYPELKGVNDSSLDGLYFSYQGSFNLVNGYDIYREEAFVFYLICDLAGVNFEKPEDIFMGEIIANFLLKNQEIEEARELAGKIREIYRSHSGLTAKRKSLYPILTDTIGSRFIGKRAY